MGAPSCEPGCDGIDETERGVTCGEFRQEWDTMIIRGRVSLPFVSSIQMLTLIIPSHHGLLRCFQRSDPVVSLSSSVVMSTFSVNVPIHHNTMLDNRLHHPQATISLSVRTQAQVNPSRMNVLTQGNHHNRPTFTFSTPVKCSTLVVASLSGG